MIGHVTSHMTNDVISHVTSNVISHVTSHVTGHVMTISEVKAPASLNSVGVRTQYMRCGVGRE